ncbi:MAG: YHS domain-containing protein [Desulfosalsimonas sp.]|uniref:YHS domain-containing protein n=1 Tax=Desulfosalsimonas sp. TaxID=3073848 RepID=UPI003970FE7B
MTRDPVCGMEVDDRSAQHKFSYLGKTYHFCTRACQEAFSSNPDRYLAQKPLDIGTSRKIAVVGLGQVGATFAFALMTTGMASEIVLIDTYVAHRISGFAMNRVIGSGTVVDTARFRFLLSRHCGVDARNVQAFVIGEHGDTEVPVWSQVNIAGMGFDHYCAMSQISCEKDDQDLLFNQVKRAAYEIINRKGYTNHAIALGLIQILSSILRGENSVLTISSLIDGYYGIGDVCMSLPAVLSQNGIQRQLFMELSDEEVAMFQYSAKKLKEVIQQLDV